MLFWQFLIVVTVIGFGLFSPTVGRVIAGCWAVWTFFVVLRIYPPHVAVIQFSTIAVSVSLISFIGSEESIFGTGSDRTLIDISDQLVTQAKSRQSRQVFFEDWVIRRNDIVRKLRTRIATPHNSLSSSIRQMLRLRTVEDKLKEAEKRLLSITLEYKASKNLPHRTQQDSSPHTRRPRKHAVRKFSFRGLASELSCCWIIIVWILWFPTWFLFFVWDFRIVAAILISEFLLLALLSIPYRAGKGWREELGPRRLHDSVHVPDDPRHDPFRHL
jgi:hypothetical protein